jgi:tripartite ATP-independent transporter DctM subunit
MVEFIPLLLFATVCIVLLIGYPVAFSLAGTALVFAAIGIVTNTFDSNLIGAFSNRLFGIMSNENMGGLFGGVRGGLSISVILVGMLLAASTGIVGATVVTMGLMSLPTMLRYGYQPALATGTICATGTLGQIIPPSIALVLLGDVLSSAYQQAQLNAGATNISTVSVGDLFVGALIPGLLLVVFYIAYVALLSWRRPGLAPAGENRDDVSLLQTLAGLLPPVILIIAVLGSIFSGIATPTEAAGVGALGASLLALLKRQLNKARLKEVLLSTMQVTSMVFMILISATLFSLVFRGFGGEELIQQLFASMPGGVIGATLVVMLVIFLLGFILDFIEITFVVVPIVGPILLTMGVDPIWLGIMIAINLQTSFLTPPFGFALFYLRGVVPESVSTSAIYRGVIPFILIQLLLLGLLALWPGLVTWLPNLMR